MDQELLLDDTELKNISWISFSGLLQFGRLDANYGLVLINKGKRVLEVVEDKQSGLAITGQVRDMVLFQQGVQKKVLFFMVLKRT